MLLAVIDISPCQSLRSDPLNVISATISMFFVQIQDAIKNGQRGAGGIDSETGIELYRILDEENIQAVLKAHDQLAANNSRAAAGAIRQQFADEQHGRPVVTSFAAANSNGHLTPRQVRSRMRRCQC